ncbi:hypothetical protein HPG69_009579 [Diceros bicornis minor]|uniref:Cation/H+ exchanger transmembrane domain-containing protein n=1 Tax=Diceros bicornis minor TaxID=77932 RepID=A0A7J7EX25_DICBM|nr:hypothetical protein HPG69_009579 [Diceros bicornis minor]
MKVLEKNYFWMLLPLLHWIANAAEHEEVAKHAIKLHRGRGAAVTQRRQWVLDSCRKLSGLLRQKAAVLNKLKNAIRAVERDASLSDEERLFQVHTFEIFQKELNESENSVFQAIYGLQRALQGDYRDVVNMKESSRQRLEALREAAIKEETEYVELLAAEKHQVEALKNMQHRNRSLSMLDEILEDVRKAADRLEEEIEEHAFDDNKSVKGVNFEAVLRVEEEEANSKQNLTKREVEDDLGLSMLIDSQNNRYILTKPRDATIPRADHHFIKDIVTIGMLSLPCGWLCTTIGLPTMFGYIICGVLLGPSGLNIYCTSGDIRRIWCVLYPFSRWLRIFPRKAEKVRVAAPGAQQPYERVHRFECVEMMTLGVGLPCSLQSCFLGDSGLPMLDSQCSACALQGAHQQVPAVTNMRVNSCVLFQVWKISLQGPCYMTLLMIAFGLLWGHLLQIRPTQSVFISTCLSLSSTPLVSRFLVGSARGEKEGDIDYSAVLLGMLVMQDVQLGLFIAAMPTLIQAGASTYSRHHCHGNTAHTGSDGSDSVFASCCFSLMSRHKDVSRGAVLSEASCGKQREQGSPCPRNLCFHFLHVNGNSQNTSAVTELLDVSMELGCFLAGALISSQGHTVTEEIVAYVEPIRDFLAIIFFTSIGLHVFPTFVAYELTVLMVLTLSVVIMKFVLAALVLSLLLPKTSQYIKWIVAAGLAQVSEFSFVLGSRARRAGIISREVYLLILSVTTLSLLLAPVLWRAAITKCVLRPERRSSL